MELSTLSPDFEAFVDRFQSKLAGMDSWKDLITAATGQTLTEFAAEVGTYDQLGIQRAYEEGILDLTRLPSSVVWIVRMFGVHVQRRNPPWVTVQLDRPRTAAEELRAYSTFFIDGVRYYNRDAVYYPEGVTTMAVRLYQGELLEQQFTATGAEFQTFVAGINEIGLADTDLRVWVDDVEFTVIRSGLWLCRPGEQKVFENTLPDGNILLQFGDTNFGVSPKRGSIVTVRFIQTEGVNGNDSRTGVPVVSAENGLYSGTTLTMIRDGEASKSAAFYKAFGPALYAAGPEQLMVRRADHNAVARTYPGVVDCIFLGQAETHPEDYRYMGAVTAIILTSTPWTEAEWQEFVAWYRKRSFFNLRLIRIDPVPTDVDADYIVYGKPGADLAELKKDAEQMIERFFQPRPNTLGFSLATNDLDNDLRDSNTDIDYVQRRSPVGDVPQTDYDYLRLRSMKVVALPTNRRSRVYV